MKYKQVPEFRWLIVLFVLALTYYCNLFYVELPFVRVDSERRAFEDGLIPYLLGLCPQFSAEFHAYSFQTIVVWLSGVILGSRLALITISAYVLLGIFGLPIFAGGGGFDYFKEPTFGYLISLPLNAYLCGYLYEKFNDKGAVTTPLQFIFLPVLCTHLIGITYLLFFNPSFLDFTWHLSFSMIGYDLIFCFILMPILPILSFFLNEITMQELPVHESFTEQEEFNNFQRMKRLS